MEDKHKERIKNFDRAFDEAGLKKVKVERRAELRRNKRNEAVYVKREFQMVPGQESQLNGELTIAYLRSDELEVFIQGANSFAKLLNETYSDPFIDTCIDSLMLFPQFPDSNRGFISTSLLASLSNSAYSHLLTAYIPTLISLISSSESKIQENLYWILGNIALDSDKNREHILAYELFNISHSIIVQPQSQFLTKKICWCLSHCCKGKFFENQLKTLPFLFLALKNNIIDIYSEVLWALAHISDKKVEVIDDKECLSSILKLLKIDLVKFQQPAIRVIGNVLNGNEAQVDLLVNIGVIKGLVSCLEHKSRLIRQEAMWAFSNLCTTKYVKTLATKGIIKKIIDLSITDCPDIQNEAIWSIFNSIFSSDPTGIKDLVDLGILSAVCYLLNLANNSSKLLLLNGIDRILRTGQEISPNPYIEILESNGGKETIEHLLMNQNEKVQKNSLRILSEYFDANDNEMMLVPANNFEF